MTIWTKLLLLWCHVAAVLVLGGFGETKEPQRVEIRTDQAVEALKNIIGRAVAESGGDVELQHLHLVWGFSTGHFAADPLAAQAARAIAWSVSRDLLVGGDQVSAYAWEAQIWQHPGAVQNPLTIRSDDPREKEQIKDLFPLTPAAGSVGGHDTERAIVEIAEKVGNNAVVILITNTAASISTPHAKAIGANNPRYQAVLQKWRRLPQTNRSGASLVLPFTAILPENQVIARTLDAVIVVPCSFFGASLQHGTRTARLAAQRRVRTQPESLGKLLVAVVLLLLVFVAVYLISKQGATWSLFAPKATILQVEGKDFELQNYQPGQEVCRLVGPGFPDATPKTISPSSAGQLPSGVQIARLVRDKGGVRVEWDSEQFQSVTVLGERVDGSHYLLRWTINETEYRFVFAGDFVLHHGMPPERIEVPMEVRMRCLPTHKGGHEDVGNNYAVS